MTSWYDFVLEFDLAVVSLTIKFLLGNITEIVRCRKFFNGMYIVWRM